jgi:hypothetical protein
MREDGWVLRARSVLREQGPFWRLLATGIIDGGSICGEQLEEGGVQHPGVKSASAAAPIVLYCGKADISEACEGLKTSERGQLYGGEVSTRGSGSKCRGFL